MFYPTKTLKRVTDITIGLLNGMGITALILDIDNTLTTHDNPNALENLPIWLDTMKQEGIELIIVSNNTADRVRSFASTLGLPFVCDAKKPLSKGYREAVATIGVSKDKIAIVGDQLFTDILGANLFNIKSILVEPIELEDKLFFKVKRFFERILLKYYKKGDYCNDRKN